MDNLRRFWIYTLFYVVLILFSFIIVRIPLIYPIAMLLILGVGIATIVNPNFGLEILVFSMLLSPEIKIADVPGRAVVLRFDDILLFIIFIAWLTRTAINKELGLFRTTPLTLPILYYLGICFVSTGLGIVRGNVVWKQAFFYLLKFVEYAMVYFMVSNILHTEKQVKRFLWMGLATYIIVVIYGYTQLNIGNVSAPFDQGEPASMGGYMIIIMAVLYSIFIHSSNQTTQLVSIGVFVFSLLPFFYTYSRASYLGFVGMLTASTLLAPKRRIVIWSIFVIALFLAPQILPESTKQRIQSTFRAGPMQISTQYGTITLDESAAARIESWKKIMYEKWKRQFLVGFGLTGLGFIDSQYFRVIGELGAVGMLIFSWLIFTLFRTARVTYFTCEETWIKAVSYGFICGFVGLLIHSLTSNSFIIVRIMEPFWFFAALVVCLPQIIKEEKKTIVPVV